MSMCNNFTLCKSYTLRLYIVIAYINELKGFPDAIQSTFPDARIIHMIRNSLKYNPHKNKKVVSADLKKI
jgi:putative transposase